MKRLLYFFQLFFLQIKLSLANCIDILWFFLWFSTMLLVLMSYNFFGWSQILKKIKIQLMSKRILINFMKKCICFLLYFVYFFQLIHLPLDFFNRFLFDLNFVLWDQFVQDHIFLFLFQWNLRFLFFFLYFRKRRDFWWNRILSKRKSVINFLWNLNLILASSFIDLVLNILIQGDNIIDSKRHKILIGMVLSRVMLTQIIRSKRYKLIWATIDLFGRCESSWYRHFLVFLTLSHWFVGDWLYTGLFRAGWGTALFIFRIALEYDSLLDSIIFLWYLFLLEVYLELLLSVLLLLFFQILHLSFLFDLLSQSFFF